MSPPTPEQLRIRRIEYGINRSRVAAHLGVEGERLAVLERGYRKGGMYATPEFLTRWSQALDELAPAWISWSPAAPEDQGGVR